MHKISSKIRPLYPQPDTHISIDKILAIGYDSTRSPEVSCMVVFSFGLHT